MARPLASPAPRSLTLDGAAGAGAAAAVLAVLAVFVGWPVVAAIGTGLAALSAPPLGVVLVTIAAALASTVAALVAGAPLAYAVLRVDVPGRELVWCVFRLGILVPPFVVPLALLVLAGPAVSLSGFVAIVIGQAVAFLPHATALLVRALAGVPVELEQAAEVLGAPRLTVLRRVTLGVAGPRVRAAAFVVLGLCLADVATPLLVGGDTVVLASAVVAAASGGADVATGAALALAALAAVAAVFGATWRHAGLAAPGWLSLPRLDRPAPAVARWSFGAAVWLAGLTLATSWAIVPLGSLLRVADGAWALSLEHWARLTTPAGAWPLWNSLMLALGAGLAGTTLALAAAGVEARGRAPLRRGVDALTRLPVAVPGVVASVGYVLAFGVPTLAVAGTWLLLVAVVACWALPVTLGVARAVLARTDPGLEDAAISLGAGRLTTLRRIVLPVLRPAAGWIFGYSFTRAMLAVGTVVVLAGAGPPLGATAILALAVSGAPGAACAVATVLLALAGGAMLLGRALAGREHVSTLHV
jgi:iron(III) transport system permease protein